MVFQSDANWLVSIPSLYNENDTHIPSINLKQRRIRRLPDIRQNPDSYTKISTRTQPQTRVPWLHTNNIIHPIILLTPRLQQNPQMQLSRRRLRPRRPYKDILPIVRPEVIPRVGGENIRCGVCGAPVCADVEDLTFTLVNMCFLLKGLYGGAVPDRRGPVKFPPTMGIVFRMPAGPLGPGSSSWLPAHWT